MRNAGFERYERMDILKKGKKRNGDLTEKKVVFYVQLREDSTDNKERKRTM